MRRCFPRPCLYPLQSSPLGEDSTPSKKRYPPCYYVRGVLCSPLAPNASALSFQLFPFFVFGSSLQRSGRSVCGRVLRWVATLQSKPPPCPPSGGVEGATGRGERRKVSEAHSHTYRLPHHIGKKEENEHMYTIYGAFCPLRAEYSTKKGVYVKGKRSAGLSPPLTSPFFALWH